MSEGEEKMKATHLTNSAKVWMSSHNPTYNQPYTLLKTNPAEPRKTFSRRVTRLQLSSLDMSCKLHLDNLFQQLNDRRHHQAENMKD